jgi:hypothetical protein
MKILACLLCLLLQSLLPTTLFAQPVATSDLKDRTRVEVSVYNSIITTIRVRMGDHLEEP